jgi:hypothetical protein
MMSPAAATDASTNAWENAMSRGDLLRALVRAHQRLVEARVQSTRRGAPQDLEIERDLAVVAERITKLLSNPEESGP